MIKESLLALAVATSYTPKITITPTKWLIQSIGILVKVQEALCKKHDILQKECSESLGAEILAVRQHVDAICEKEAKPTEQVECINYGMEYVLDKKIIPAKVSLLKTVNI